MRSSLDPAVSVCARSVSLILPITNGSALNGNEVAEYRAILEKQTGFESVEVIVSRGRRDMLKSVQSPDEALDDPSSDFGKCVWSDTSEWPTLVRAGLAAASGDHLVILDVNRHYSPDSLIRVLDPVRGNQCDLAVAIPRGGAFDWPVNCGLGSACALSAGCFWALQTFSRVCSRLRREAWDSEFRHRPPRGSILVLDTLLRRHARSMDVPVAVGSRFRDRPARLERPATSQAPSRSQIWQLLATCAILHCRGLRHGRRSIALRPASILALVHLAR